MLSKCLPLCCNSSPLYRFYSNVVLRQGASFEHRLALSSGPSCLVSQGWDYRCAPPSHPPLALCDCFCLVTNTFLYFGDVCAACPLFECVIWSVFRLLSPSCLALSVCDIVFSQGYHCLGGKQIKKGGRIEAQFFLLMSWRSVWKNLTYAAVPPNEIYPSLCS